MQEKGFFFLLVDAMRPYKGYLRCAELTWPKVCILRSKTESQTTIVVVVVACVKCILN